MGMSEHPDSTYNIVTNALMRYEPQEVYQKSKYRMSK